MARAGHSRSSLPIAACLDAIFPVLPRWFTEPLHAHVGGPGAHYQGPGGSPRLAPPSPTLERREDEREESHEHAFLETLFNDVFENRFINPIPSCESSRDARVT